MNGIVNLETLLENIRPLMSKEEFVFCSVPGASYGDFNELQPICSFMEDEGLTLIFNKDNAENHGLQFYGIFKKITLQVHSSLEAVGLTAVVSGTLAKRGISANVVAAYYHDHIFVPLDKSEEALEVLLSSAKGD